MSTIYGKTLTYRISRCFLSYYYQRCWKVKYIFQGLGINEICKDVGGAYKVSKDEISVKGRKGNEGRDMAIYLSRKYTRSTCDEIGEYFGGIRPSAVSLGNRRIKERIKADKNFKK